MKYKPSLIGDMSGSLGAITASHNAYGQYLRIRVKPVQPRTIGQQDQRLAFGHVSQIWRTLNDVQRNTWITQAPQFRILSSTGNQITPTGQALYMYINVLRERLGLTLNDVPPPTPEPAPITPVTISLAGNNSLSVAFNADDPWHAAGGAALVSVSPPMTRGRSFMQTFTPLGIIDANTASPVAFDLPFVPAPGDNLKVRVSASAPNGRRSTIAYSWLYPPVIGGNITIDIVTGTTTPGDPVTVALINAGAVPGTVAITATTSTGPVLYQGEYDGTSASVELPSTDDASILTNNDPWTLELAPADWLFPQSGQVAAS